MNKEKSYFFKEEMWVTISSLFLLTSLIGALTFVELEAKQFWLWVSISVIITLIVYFVLVSLIRKTRTASKERNRLQLENQQKKLNVQYNEEMQGLYQELEELQAEGQTHISTMKQMLKEERYEELRKYFSDFNNVIYQSERIFLSGNQIIDVVMSQKISRALKKQIHIKCDIQAIYLEHILDMDLCSLLSNVLDNAIEAVEKCDDKLISLTIKKEKNCLIIKEDNAYKEIIKDDNKKLKTTKKEQDVHGFGMRSMENVVEQYNGMMKHHVENGRFYITIVMEDKEK